MKSIRITALAILLTGILGACSSSKQVRSNTRNINGNWLLKTVSTEGITGKIKMQLFNEADFNCFIGSTWHFDNKNNLGYYSIEKNAGECAAIKREIRWSFDESVAPVQFQFKRLNEKLKDLDENAGGFKFSITQLESATMTLQSAINFEGKPATVTYYFVRL
ncbi:MAG TPA: DUF5004 domain-containing protein [Ferruginibacter sp.]|nr:DUF5004 domain-containing protein [Ferruginibacter sp.]